MSEYGFGGRLTKEFPSQINVDLTYLCNLACVHCPHSSMEPQAIGTEHSLSIALNKKLIGEVAEDGVGYIDYIRYTGDGEPFLNKNIIEILDYAVRNSGTNVTLTTNGTLIKGETVKKLMETNLFSIDISIDAYSEETYGEIRRGGNFKDVVSNVKALLKYREENNKRTKLVVSFVKQPLNEHETEKFEKFWYSEGVDFVVIRRLHSVAGFDSATAEKLRLDAGSRTPCLYPWERLVVKPTGIITYCPEISGDNSGINFNLNNVSIKDAWQSKELNALREAHLSGNLEMFNACNNCPDWINTRWPHEGRSYADMMKDFENQN